jgi:hypothetical protein
MRRPYQSQANPGAADDGAGIAIVIRHLALS